MHGWLSGAVPWVVNPQCLAGGSTWRLSCSDGLQRMQQAKGAFQECACVLLTPAHRPNPARRLGLPESCSGGMRWRGFCGKCVVRVVVAKSPRALCFSGEIFVAGLCEAGMWSTGVSGRVIDLKHSIFRQ